MDSNHLRKMIEVVVKHNFENMAEQFNKNPNASNNWQDMEDAMWARQAIASESTMSQALGELADLGIGHWIAKLRELHEGQLK
jgi:hypothetical protein